VATGRTLRELFDYSALPEGRDELTGRLGAGLELCFCLEKGLEKRCEPQGLQNARPSCPYSMSSGGWADA
jgi:hypothetical protein